MRGGASGEQRPRSTPRVGEDTRVLASRHHQAAIVVAGGHKGHKVEAGGECVCVCRGSGGGAAAADSSLSRLYFKNDKRTVGSSSRRPPTGRIKGREDEVSATRSVGRVTTDAHPQPPPPQPARLHIYLALIMYSEQTCSILDVLLCDITLVEKVS